MKKFNNETLKGVKGSSSPSVVQKAKKFNLIKEIKVEKKNIKHFFFCKFKRMLERPHGYGKGKIFNSKSIRTIRKR